MNASRWAALAAAVAAAQVETRAAAQEAAVAAAQVEARAAERAAESTWKRRWKFSAAEEAAARAEHNSSSVASPFA